MTIKLSQIWKAKDLRNNLLFILAIMVLFRLAAHIPIPGVDAEAMTRFFRSNQVLGMMNIFSGGGMENFSIVMMGVGPYITSSIIFQLLSMIVPKFEEMQKEESGRQKINMWTRWLTVPLAALQAYGMIAILRQSPARIINELSFFDLFSTITVIVAGTILLMWLGELISEKKMGNGISLLIFAGIVSGIPNSMRNIYAEFSASGNIADIIIPMALFLIIAIAVIAGVVFITEAQRNIPVQYAKQMRGMRANGGSVTHLPIRLNMGGVIPIIFAISVIMFPPLIAQFFVTAKTAWISGVADQVKTLFDPNGTFYLIAYFVLVFAFTFFYTEVIFHPTQIAENLQKQGGFIPGIRPGRHTSEYLAMVTYRVILAGALFLSIIAVLPFILRFILSSYGSIQSLTIGGTSLLIVVAVVIETIKQIDAQLTMREYDAYSK